MEWNEWASQKDVEHHTQGKKMTKYMKYFVIGIYSTQLRSLRFSSSSSKPLQFSWRGLEEEMGFLLPMWKRCHEPQDVPLFEGAFKI
jgi:hypothetical protein